VKETKRLGDPPIVDGGGGDDEGVIEMLETELLTRLPRFAEVAP